MLPIYTTTKSSVLIDNFFLISWIFLSADFRFRTLNILPNTPLWKEWKSGKFILLKPVDCIKEERDIIANLGDNVTSQVFNDHVSNYCSIESSNVREDREMFIKTLDSFINDPRIQKLPRQNRISL